MTCRGAAGGIMASAYGPESASPAPIHPIGDLEPVVDVEATSPPAHTMKRAAPPPNPSFSFPMRDDETPSAPIPTPTVARASRRRPVSAIETPTQSYQLTTEATERPQARASLPAFSFNPGASLPPDPNDPMLSPPISPQSPRTLPSGEKPIRHGHRRGGSEFVGGRLREGNSIAVMSSSPTKPESGFNSPSLAPPRRGHRRGVSSALSTSDLSLLPPPQHDFSFKGSSAPNSPTNFDQIPAMPPIPAKYQEEVNQQVASTPDIPKATEVEGSTRGNDSSAEDDLPPKPASRTRVGFSDTLEFIPRPLSLVSTDTSSTITAKPGHAVSGSISSLVNTSPSGRDSPAAKSHSPSYEGSRPSTAGAILERTPTVQADEFNTSPRRRNSIPALLDLAEASATEQPTPSPTKASRRWTFFGLDPFSSTGSPSRTRPHSASSGESATRVVSGASSSDHSSESPAEGADLKNDKKKSKRRKMVKGWADSILPRKPKQSNRRSKYSVRPPTPPASIVPPEEDDEDAMDVDQPAQPQGQAPPTVTVTESPTPPRPSKQRADDISSPMIDLDAALGPFNTPLPSNPEWDAAQRAAGNANRRRLHSAQGMRGFSGPGMHYHRRAESAPDLPPFDPGTSSIHRFGSSSTMADVFEEDEEEAEEEDGRSSKPATSTHSSREEESDGDTTPPAVVPTDSTKEPARSFRRKSSGVSDLDQSSVASIRAQRSKTSLHDNVIVEEPSSNVRFRTNNMFGGGSEASGSPTMSLRKTSGTRELPSFELGPPPVPYTNMPVSPHSMSYASSPRSPMSADTQRLSTAPSSVHEDNSFRSLLMGEPGPEVRLSADYDIPSLTSSNSTMTRDSNFPSQARMSQPTLREPRPLSVSSAAFGRRRSSLVSLSRLISSSHGERSKLSMEVTLDNDESKKSRNSKTKRLGRLVQFWKPKEGAREQP